MRERAGGGRTGERGVGLESRVGRAVERGGGRTGEGEEKGLRGTKSESARCSTERLRRGVHAVERSGFMERSGVHAVY